MYAWDVATHLAALADEARIGMMTQLAAAGGEGMALERLAERTGLEPSELLVHVEALAAAGLVERAVRRGGVMIVAREGVIDLLLAFLARRLAPRSDYHARRARTRVGTVKLSERLARVSEIDPGEAESRARRAGAGARIVEPMPLGPPIEERADRPTAA